MSKHKAKGYVKAEDLHHATLSPSSFPKLMQCIHFASGKVGAAADRGTVLHKQISDFLTNGTPIEDEGARAACNRARNYIMDRRGVEQKLSLFGEDFDEVTFGTADVWGYDDEGILTLVDFKSGSQPPESYTEQMAVYALMLMEQEGKSSCLSIIVGIDSGEDYPKAWSYDHARKVVWGIIERVREGTEAPQENSFCGWCAKKAECPVYKAPATAALTLIPKELPADFKFTREWITASPQNAAIALDALDKLEAVFEELAVKDTVKQAIIGGTQIAGWKIQERKGSVSLDATKVRTMWKTLTDLPIPEKTGSPSQSLVRSKS